MNFAIILFMGTFALLHLLHAVDGAAAQLQVGSATVNNEQDTWNIEESGINTVAIDFLLPGIADEDVSRYFTASATNCGVPLDSGGWYSFSSEGDATGITVTLTNSGTTSSLSSELVACIKVELFLPALQELPIHTKQFTLTITVEDGGSVNVITVIDEANLGLAMAPDEFVEEDFSGSRPAPPIDVAILTPSPIQYGQTVTLSASNDLGYYLRVVGLTPPMVNEIFPDTLTLGKSDATFEIPFEKFLSGTSLELTVSVEWSMTIGEGGRRQLLASTSSLRNGRFASDLSSSTERHHHELIQLKLELDPSSVMVAGGYSVKVVSILGIVTTTMVAAAAAALV